MDLRLGRLLDRRDERREEFVSRPDDPFGWVPVEGVGPVAEVAAGKKEEEEGQDASKHEEEREERRKGEERETHANLW